MRVATSIGFHRAKKLGILGGLYQAGSSSKIHYREQARRKQNTSPSECIYVLLQFPGVANMGFAGGFYYAEYSTKPTTRNILKAKTTHPETTNLNDPQNMPR